MLTYSQIQHSAISGQLSARSFQPAILYSTNQPFNLSSACYSLPFFDVGLVLSHTLPITAHSYQLSGFSHQSLFFSSWPFTRHSLRITVFQPSPFNHSTNQPFNSPFLGSNYVFNSTNPTNSMNPTNPCYYSTNQRLHYSTASSLLGFHPLLITHYCLLASPPPFNSLPRSGREDC